MTRNSQNKNNLEQNLESFGGSRCKETRQTEVRDSVHTRA